MQFSFFQLQTIACANKNRGNWKTWEMMLYDASEHIEYAGIHWIACQIFRANSFVWMKVLHANKQIKTISLNWIGKFFITICGFAQNVTKVICSLQIISKFILHINNDVRRRHRSRIDAFFSCCYLNFNTKFRYDTCLSVYIWLPFSTVHHPRVIRMWNLFDTKLYFLIKAKTFVFFLGITAPPPQGPMQWNIVKRITIRTFFSLRYHVWFTCDVKALVVRWCGFVM